VSIIGLGSYSGVEARDGFNVVIEDVGRGRKDYVQGRGISPEVRN
jgi:hypothetical protein